MDNTNQQPTPPVQVQTPPVSTSHSHKMLYIIAGIVLLILALAGGYVLGQQNSVSQITYPGPSLPVQVTTEPVTNETANWESYQIKTLGIEFKLPPDLSKYGNMNEEVTQGDKGTQLDLTFSKSGGSNIANYIFFAGTTSFDYTAGRGGRFLDYQGYSSSNGKYYARFYGGMETELPSNLVKEVTSQYGVKILRIVGKIGNDPGAGVFAVPGTPGDGFIGALVNVNKSPYSGVAFQMKLEGKLNENLFDQILSTFKFTQ